MINSLKEYIKKILNSLDIKNRESRINNLLNTQSKNSSLDTQNKETRTNNSLNTPNKEPRISKMKKVNLFDKIKFIKLSKESPKINMEKVKEVALVASAVVLIGVGYVNFSGNKTPNETIEKISKSTNNIGDVQLVSSNAVLVDNSKEGEKDNSATESTATTNGENAEANNQNSDGAKSENIVNNENETNKDESENTSKKGSVEEVSALVGNEEKTTNYFASLKLERNDMYSKSLETYQKIVDSTTISGEQKAIAIQEIEKLNKDKNSISVAEELIKLKGFEDVVIYSSEDSVSVIVRCAKLSNTQVAQIQNIVSREFGVDVSRINISNK